MDGYTVGHVAALSGVTVRTLHHYDRIGLLRPSARTAAGYRQYDRADLDRLEQVLSYRELGFALEDIQTVLDQPDADRADHLRRQHRLVRERIDRLGRMLGHLETAMEAQQMGIALTPEEQFEVFGPDLAGGRLEEYATQAEQLWGQTEAWRASQRRTAAYTKEDWTTIKAEAADLEQRLADALRAGEPAGSARAMDLAAAHRAHLERWFYDVPPAVHRGLGDMYVADPRFTAHYDGVEPELAAYLRDAIHANADRAQLAEGR